MPKTHENKLICNTRFLGTIYHNYVKIEGAVTLFFGETVTRIAISGQKPARKRNLDQVICITLYV